MTPAARLQAAIELTAALLPLERPADQVVAQFLRARRYIGGGDRRRILDLTYGVLRSRAKLLWWLERTAGAFEDDIARARAMVIAYLVLCESWSADKLAGSFDGQGHNPGRLDVSEKRLALALEGKELAAGEQAPDVIFEVPRFSATSWPRNWRRCWRKPPLTCA